MAIPRRHLGVILVGVFVVVAIGGLATSLSSAGSSVGRMGSPAAPGEPTYILDDFELQYPFVDTTASYLGDPEDGTKAGVRFTTEWAGNEFPGVSTCQISAFNEQHQVVGTLVSKVESLSPEGRPAGWTPIAVSMTPTSIESACSAASKPSADAAYTFSDPVVAGNGDDVRIVGDIEWSTGESPGTAGCTASVDVVGHTKAVDFTLDAAEGHSTIVLLPGSFEGGTLEDLSCGPFTARR